MPGYFGGLRFLVKPCPQAAMPAVFFWTRRNSLASIVLVQLGGAIVPGNPNALGFLLNSEDSVARGASFAIRCGSTVLKRDKSWAFLSSMEGINTPLARLKRPSFRASL
ncbi:hypothetical protein CBM2631_B180003 [Cupriavidus taiwanensis]|nr:hypothetical protein CBM2591_B140004 [Cupriavidus taiwanensis]SOZ71602.1 hypothetical protein CBM2617_B180003 [Cupriavidus taiwanensis]SOZ86852.1 hypothetical protein CBM2618_B200003 [Cupriavidus taiwanensis]SOZ89953.1 hypothetical protein CBM2622_B190003 [Cupriavidus taiwanensis]SPA20294.1 hypothetical protein CBM2631_B180003 [Cupriavidus taiwanensis]